MTFLEDLVYSDERLECLDLVSEDWLPVVMFSSETLKHPRGLRDV
jgi:hypothetical protein